MHIELKCIISRPMIQKAYKFKSVLKFVQKRIKKIRV